LTVPGARKSAVVIPFVRAAGGLLVLAGRRSGRSRFLGGFFAFPGGVHEPSDGDLAREGEEACLRRTAARELREETGLVVEPAALLGAGRRISPPFTAVRFDSLIFAAELPAAIPAAASDELEELAWTPPGELVRRWRALEIRVAPPLLPMLHALAALGPAASAREIAGSVEAANTFPEEEGPRIEFVPDVLLLPQRTRTLPPATTTNCYLVGAKELLVIDPGSAEPRERARLRNQLARRAREGATPRAIVLTHHHGDHVGGAAPLAREAGLPVWAHAETLARWPEAAAAAPGAGVRALAEGDVLPLAGGERVRVLHTPGHAEGHVALFEETRGSLFAGDLVSGISTILVDSVPGSLDRYLASLRRLLELPARTLFPAHGPPMIRPDVAIRGVLAHREERERRILGAVGAGARRVEDIVRAAYADTPDADAGLAARQAEAHLERLAERGRVLRRGDGWEPSPLEDPGLRN
jgi:glyoxylase-like metal-dependent hydrolase (beta-lactamase superfamily II)/8-oxo-dGTP pyrophosphatase MutT (NUDIX family)